MEAELHFHRLTMIRTLLADLQFAARQLRGSPVFTAVAVATLALGIAANAVIFSVLEGFILRPLQFQNPDQLVYVQQTTARTGQTMGVSWPDFADWRASSGFAGMTALQIETFNVTGLGGAQRVRGSRVSPNFFRVMGVAPQLGRTFSAEPGDAAPLVVVSHSFWVQQLGGSRAALGQTLNIDGRPYIIGGVMPASMFFPAQFSQFWVPMLEEQTARMKRDDRCMFVVGRLRDGTPLAQARTSLEAVAARLENAYPASNKGMGVRLTRLSEALSRGPRRALTVLFATVVFVLLICCANIANLLLARAVHRDREIAIRMSLGASRVQLLRLLFTESLLLASLGGIAGLLLASAGVAALSAAIPIDIQPAGGIAMNLQVCGFGAVLTILTAMLFGFVPARRLLRRETVDALRDAGSATSRLSARNPASSLLVVGEMSLAVVLLISAGLLMGWLRHTQAADPGFRPGHVLTAELSTASEKYRDPARQAMAIDEVLARLSSTPGVVTASAVNWPPMTSDTIASFTLEGRNAYSAAALPTASYRVATPGYAKAMGIPVLRGRFINDADRLNADPVVVVNQHFAGEYWPGEDPLGKHLAFATGPGQFAPWATVVGVVGDVRHPGPAGETSPEFFFPFAQRPQPNLYLAIRTAADPAMFSAKLQRLMKENWPDLPLNLVRPMERVMADQITPNRIVTVLLTLFSAIALMLACMGLYGVMSYIVARRVQEFGVRLALGATSGDLLRLVLRRALRLTMAGIVLGAVAGLGARRLLSAMVEGIRPDPVFFVLVALVLAAVAMFASWMPLRRVLASGPMSSLRMS